MMPPRTVNTVATDRVAAIIRALLATERGLTNADLAALQRALRNT